jgi:7-carboxy-7-deazaguanine synthase
VKDFRLIEHYTSVQGEGPRTGEMTQFVRFAGCNMRCPLWPCDTQHAIQPAIFMEEGASYKRSVGELRRDIEHMAREFGATNICFTGGEPFMQPIMSLMTLVTQLGDETELTLECFSNGSFNYPPWALNRISFIMDWKLEGSGEGKTKLAQRRDNALALGSGDCIKFVIAHPTDFVEAQEVWASLVDEGCRAQFWAGAAWDRYNTAFLIDQIKARKLPWKVNIQIHKFIWEPDQQGV